MDINELIALSVKQNASDLHLCAGYSPVMRIDGDLDTCQVYPPLSKEWMVHLCQQILDNDQYLHLQKHGQIDFSCLLTHGVRLRGHFFHQQWGLSVALRLLPTVCPTLASLDVPEIINSLIMQKNGLILVAGATGSGKSTTLAAMINALNHACRRHIITLEDPIEFIHKSQNCLIQQRELGRHTYSLTDALHALLREDPDIVLLGELRDANSIRLALTVAETGHLVLATLHTRTATQAIERLVDVFPAQEKAYVQAQIAGSLRAVIAQKLSLKQGGGRVAIFEILTTTAAVGNLIREGKTHQLQNILQTGGQAGMQTFEQGVRQRQAQGLLATDD